MRYRVRITKTSATHVVDVCTADNKRTRSCIPQFFKTKRQALNVANEIARELNTEVIIV